MTSRSRIPVFVGYPCQLSREAVLRKRSPYDLKSTAASYLRTEPSQAFPLLDLPLDVLVVVFDFCVDEGDMELRIKASSEWSPLTLGHVCKALRDAAFSHLLPKMTFVTSVPLLEAFIRGMPDGLRPSIKSLRLKEFPDTKRHYLWINNDTDHPVSLLWASQALTEELPLLKKLSIEESRRFKIPDRVSPTLVDRCTLEVTAQQLLEHESVQWLMKCNGLSHFSFTHKRYKSYPSRGPRTRVSTYRRTVDGAMDGVEAAIRAAVTNGVRATGGTGETARNS